MSPEIQAQLRTFVIAALAAAAEIGMSAEILLQQARVRVSPAITAPELAHELRALADKGWVIEVPALLGCARWRLTALGRSIAIEQGLA